MFIADHWQSFEVLDTGDGEKLERWGKYVLRRPDPQVIWPKADPGCWSAAQAHYLRSERGGGEWRFEERLPERWQISYGDLRFHVRPTGFKHTGLFPEQAANWDWMRGLIRARSGQAKVLNLFAYTGGATLACAAEGAHVTHVDAAKGMVQWAKENMVLSHLEDRRIRFIVDDVLKFVAREKRRGRTYHAIIMDPPSYGRGPKGEIWKIEEQLYPLVSACLDILDPHPLFFLINSYTTGFPASVLRNILSSTVLRRHPAGKVEAGEIGLPISASDMILPCGIYGRWIEE